MTLRAKQALFGRLIAMLILWVFEEGRRLGQVWEITLADGAVDHHRRYWRLNERIEAEDAQHMRGSLHYSRLAQDLNLFIDGEWIRTAHPAWGAIGGHWEAMDPLCRWGGRFRSVDLNHFSLEHEGRA